MKKTLLLFLLLSLFFSLAALKTFAQTASSSAPMHVEYDLPYPGLLPDNPLYYLKAIRDNILKFIISDPLKKSEFDLLQADKRLVSAQALFSKGKKELSITTLSKSGNYFDDAISNVQKAKKQGEEVRQLINKLLISSQKHQEVIAQMEENQKGDNLLNLKYLEDRAHDFEERVLIIKAQ